MKVKKLSFRLLTFASPAFGPGKIYFDGFLFDTTDSLDGLSFLLSALAAALEEV